MKRFSVEFGDMLSLKHGIIVHGCNAHGVMGSGIAAQIRSKFPLCFKKYKEFCERGQADTKKLLGRVVVYEHSDEIIIMNAITQDGFGKDGKQYVDYSAISIAFSEIIALTKTNYTQHVVNYPLIGAGLGGGDWSIISDIIASKFEDYPELSRALWIYK